MVGAALVANIQSFAAKAAPTVRSLTGVSYIALQLRHVPLD
jgi:hypothetical protein